MLIEPDCIPCILRMSVTTIKRLWSDEETRRDLCRRILQIAPLKGLEWRITSAEVVEMVMREILGAHEEADPFAEAKAEQNRMVEQSCLRLRESVRAAKDPLGMAMKLAIIGNAIDFMVPDQTRDLEKLIRQRLRTPLPKGSVSDLPQRLAKAKRVLYVGDNAGEIVLDKLFIEVMRERYDVEVVFVVRSLPSMNDATLRDAQFVGMDQVASVVENGIDGPLPGTVLGRCSKETQELFATADLIISKGGGNFDTLDEEKGLGKEITFMLLAKCQPYYKVFGVEVNKPILASRYVN